MKIHATTSVTGPEKASFTRQAMFGTILTLTLLAVFVPFSPHMPVGGLDPSWALGMLQAQSQSLTIGQDIIFTFGPYSSIYTKLYHPATDGLMLWGSIYLALSLSLASFYTFRDMKAWYQAILILSFTLWLTSRDALFFIHPLIATFYAFQQSRPDDAHPDSPRFDYLFVPIIFSALGFYPLVKGSTIAICFAGAVLSALIYFSNRKYLNALLTLAAPVLGFTLGWVMSGQPLASAGDFLLNLKPIISGYTGAMASQGPELKTIYTDLIIYILGSIIILVSSRHIGAQSRLTQIMLSLMVLGTLFVAFKAGFVRHDGHATLSAKVLFFAALITVAFVTRKKTVLVCLLTTLIGSVVINRHYDKTSVSELASNALRHFSAAISGIQTRILKPEQYAAAYRQRLDELRASSSLPKLPGSSDIYSYDQAFLIASGNTWNPRPILQSYSAYTPELLEANHRHLLGEKSPDNIFFTVQPIDNRLPALEDGNSWRTLINRYSPTGLAAGYLTLKKDEEPEAGNRITLLTPEKKSFKLGETLDIPDHDGPLFIKIDTNLNPIGKILNTAFKPTQLEITVTLRSGMKRQFRFVSDMAKTEFLLSPLVENTQDYAALYENPELISEKHVKSIQITGMFNGLGWNRNISVELTPSDYKENKKAYGLYKIAAPETASDNLGHETAKHCSASVDYINGLNPPPASFKLGRFLKMNGWIAKSVSPGQAAGHPYIVLVNTKNRDDVVYYKTERVNRGDVGAHFKSNALNDSGFDIRADTSMLKGEYSVHLGYLEDGRILTCAPFKYTATAE